jgi:hypothetical protein
MTIQDPMQNSRLFVAIPRRGWRSSKAPEGPLKTRFRYALVIKSPRLSGSIRVPRLSNRGDQIWVRNERIKATRQRWSLVRDTIALAASVATTHLMAIRMTK